MAEEKVTDEVDSKSSTRVSDNHDAHSNDGTSGQDEEQRHDLRKTNSRRSEIDPTAQPPDGGLHAWLKVFGCFLVYSNVW